MADALARVRMNMDDLSMLLREEHVFSIKDVAYAILEPNGRLSVMKTKGATSVTREDLKINKSEVSIFPS
nr:YetF domain-containing protein [Brevibacillus laterosporus]